MNKVHIAVFRHKPYDDAQDVLIDYDLYKDEYGLFVLMLDKRIVKEYLSEPRLRDVKDDVAIDYEILRFA